MLGILIMIKYISVYWNLVGKFSRISWEFPEFSDLFLFKIPGISQRIFKWNFEINWGISNKLHIYNYKYIHYYIQLDIICRRQEFYETIFIFFYKRSREIYRTDNRESSLQYTIVSVNYSHFCCILFFTVMIFLWKLANAWERMWIYANVYTYC